MSKSIKERLAAGERIFVSKEDMAKKLSFVPYVTLQTKLRELEEAEVVARVDSPRKGRPHGGKRWAYKGRTLKFVSNYVGESRWKTTSGEVLIFDEPHDLAIDPKTKMIVAYAHA